MTHTIVQADALEFLKVQQDRSVSLAFFSPPYADARTYGIDFKLKGQAWVDWMRLIIKECCRVSSGLCCANMSARVENGSYNPTVEWLVADLTRLDGIVCGPAPYAWVKSQDYDDINGNGTPGSGGSRYQRRDWEPVYCFCLPDSLPLQWTDNVAFGRPPRWRTGGRMSQRMTNGSRHNTGRMATLGAFGQPEICNPGNVIASDVIREEVGGGKLGCPIAHDGEAPMAIGVAERFVCWFAKPESIVLDCFSGTGTTAQACKRHGRNFIGCDLRQSQVDLGLKRLSLETPPLFA